MVHQDNASLSALVGARICHDLISPIGAIFNGLELVAMGSGVSASPEMGLIQQSCENAAARIQFFRIAFGTSDDHRPVPVSVAKSVLNNHFQSTRIRPDWEFASETSRTIVQLSYLSALCVETALAHGGTIRLSGTDRTIHATGQGPTINRDATLWNRLRDTTAGKAPVLRPDDVQFGLLGELCTRYGHLPTFEFGTQSVRLDLRLGQQDFGT